MKRAVLIAIALSVVAPACAGGAQTRTVLVDYNHDEFPTIMVSYFPGHVMVAAGDTLVFRQTWTGEPHTVTGGTAVNAMMKKTVNFTKLFKSFDSGLRGAPGIPEPENPTGSAADFFNAVENAKNKDASRDFLAAYDALTLTKEFHFVDRHDLGDATFADVVKPIDEASNKVFGNTGVPQAFGEDNLNQNAGQPCYLTKGLPPKDPNKPCSKSKQRQPAFNGRASYYNSGIIPYQGQQGNVFTVKLSNDIKPGKYFFFCSVHGAEQSTEVTVKATGSKIPSQAEVSNEAQKEISNFARPYEKTWRDAKDGKITFGGQTLRGPFAGLPVEAFGSINEFVPNTIRTKVGQKVTWKMVGWDHSISFGVPKYFPIMRFAKDGRVSLNPTLKKALGGSPKVPEAKEGEVLKVDGGTYDGTGFFSSSVFSHDPYAEYTLRFSKPGRYKFACLLHPPMVGTVVVTR